MNIKDYMRKVGVSKKKYVEVWLEKGLIPGVKEDENTGELFFPPSARRPYRPRLCNSAKASTIRASILNACLKREYISEKIYGMSKGEFLSFINDLLRSELISVRIEDGITYYDSTIKSDMYEGKSLKAIKKFIIDCMGEITEKAAYGTIKALHEVA
ncbi:MAG: hypothetical protein J1E34_04450 [Oscillospiraceae bacterium]|nr:hypothetical protein [Oscillospiraceae bacterium]